MSSPNAIVTTDNDHVYTTSLMVAEKFEKLHKNVLRDIDRIIKTCPDQRFNGLNFEPVNYKDAKGETRPMYNLTRQGFTMVAMGFTGQKAFLWKIAYINAFDRMEAKLNELLVNEHHGMLADLYANHPQWHLTRTYAEQGLTAREIAEKQGKHPANVRRMIHRMRQAGLYCPLTSRKQAA